MAIFRFFKMAAAAIVDFQNFKFLKVRTVEIELRRDAKFCQCWSNAGRDMTFFSIFQHGGGRHLEYFKFQTVVAVESVKLRHGAKFHWYRLNRGRGMPFLF